MSAINQFTSIFQLGFAINIAIPAILSRFVGLVDNAGRQIASVSGVVQSGSGDGLENDDRFRKMLTDLSNSLNAMNQTRKPVSILVDVSVGSTVVSFMSLMASSFFPAYNIPNFLVIIYSTVTLAFTPIGFGLINLKMQKMETEIERAVFTVSKSSHFVKSF